jgi:hypothetical protein
MELIKDEVFTFKLNSGEELMGKVKDFNDIYILISEPVSVAPGPQGIGLVPSMFTADNSVSARLNTSSISLIAPTEDSVKMKYLEATTGIKVPTKKIVLG